LRPLPSRGNPSIGGGSFADTSRFAAYFLAFEDALKALQKIAESAEAEGLLDAEPGGVGE